MKNILLILITCAIWGCMGSSKKETSTPSYFDPGAPGGTIGGTTKLPAMLNLTVSLNSSGKAQLNWTIPSTYIGQNYKINVYRINGDGVTTQLADPSDPYSSAYLFHPRPDFAPINVNNYLDTTNLISNQTYTYYVYAYVNNNWSSPSKVTITTPAISDLVSIPSSTRFWPSYTQTIGMAPSNGVLFLNTFSPGASSVGLPTGDCEFAKDGGIVYCADTANNRVIVYVSQAYQACKGYTNPSEDYSICMALYFGYPLTATAVIGQKSFSSSYACGDSGNPLGEAECLTKPRGVLVVNDKLLIAEGDRIKVYPNLPTYGCYNYYNYVGETTPDECTPYKVIGKQTLTDTSTYGISDGVASLSKPSCMAYSGSTLYICDTGNHRVVTVSNLFDDELFNCTPGTWKTSQCRFTSVLGQANFTSRETFKDKYQSSQITYNVSTHNLSDGGFFLARHFANPTRIKILDGSLLIASNEDFSDTNSDPSFNLKGRINVFHVNPINGNTPICNSGNFSSSACAADYSIGQTSYNSLIELSLGQEYSDIPYALEDLDFDIINNYMLAINKTKKQVLVWNDFQNTNPGSGTPYLYSIQNPAGLYDSGSNRVLPDLQNLAFIKIVQGTATSYVMDAILGRIYEIPLK